MNKTKDKREEGKEVRSKEEESKVNQRGRSVGEERINMPTKCTSKKNAEGRGGRGNQRGGEGALI